MNNLNVLFSIFVNKINSLLNNKINLMRLFSLIFFSLFQPKIDQSFAIHSLE